MASDKVLVVTNVCVSTELRGGAADTYRAGAEEPETDFRAG